MKQKVALHEEKFSKNILFPIFLSLESQYKNSAHFLIFRPVPNNVSPNFYPIKNLVFNKTFAEIRRENRATRKPKLPAVTLGKNSAGSDGRNFNNLVKD